MSHENIEWLNSEHWRLNEYKLYVFGSYVQNIILSVKNSGILNIERYSNTDCNLHQLIFQSFFQSFAFRIFLSEIAK